MSETLGWALISLAFLALGGIAAYVIGQFVELCRRKSK